MQIRAFGAACALLRALRHRMSSWSKLVDRARRSPQNLLFSELCRLVDRMGYDLDRIRGSHRHYRKTGYPAINLQQAPGGKAKPYQVRQVLAILDEHGFELER